MFELIFLGTSSAAPSIYRGLSAAAVLAGEHRFLVDCGEGTQRQLLRSGIGYRRMNHILLTHAHLDHILGVGGLVSTFTRWESSFEELTIQAGRSTLERVRALIYEVVLRDQTPPIPIHLVEIEPGIIFEAKHFTISAFPVQHRGAGCFGFIFQERTRRPFRADLADALGIPSGPQRGQLVRGESITLADGRVITPEMVLDAPIAGMKVVFTGDTGRTDTLLPHAAAADVLVCEATFLERDREMARQFGHITAHQAALLAKEAGVQHLLLNHLSRRYREYDMIHEARAVFPAAVVVRDLDHFILRRGQPLERLTIDATTVDDVDEETAG
ncbi:MAG: ribonuclease Z [Anaerolineae bacterium]|jgi:ribonuclease Z|nr:ribonuclease Z [Anaerolineae bacterium]